MPVTGSSLAEVASQNTEVARLLESDHGHTYISSVLSSDHGLDFSEAAVRRYRAKLPKVRRASSTPKDMPTYSEERGKEGSASLHLPRPGASEHDLLREAGFDPDSWRIKGAVNTRRWMRYDQEWLFYYKFDVEQGESERAVRAHVDDLVKRIQKRLPPPPKFYNIDHDGTYVIVLADWQIGKSEQGRGSVDTVERWRECLAQSVEEIVRLRKGGVLIDRLALLSVGDLVEGCGDHYDMQTFSVDLDRRSQNRVVREMLTSALLKLVPMFAETTVACIGGNHGENRRKGKAYTTFADNDDVANIEAVKEAFDLSEWKNHVDWVIPEEELSLNTVIGGVNIGLVHGHQFKGGANAWKKAEDWWRGNDFGLEAVQKSQILLSGHFHHLVEVNLSSNRTWMQAPTIDPGSAWYTQMTGNTSVPGVLTFVASSEFPLGYDFRRVLHPSDLTQASLA